MHELPPPPDPAAVERQRGVIVAGHAGDVDAARALLSDPAPMVRHAALSAVHRCSALTLDDLGVAFTDAAPSVRARAAELAALIEGGDPSALLHDPDPTVIEISCFACGEVDWESHTAPPPTERIAEIATGHDDALCRESAAAALGAIGDPHGLDAVLTACGDRVTVRRRATLALAAFDDPRADQALHDALDDKDWQVRQAAEDLLEVGRTLDGDPDPGAYAE